MTTFTPPSIEELQEKFPQYKIESFIAQGGMGAVYLARQVSLDRPVAIKILPQEFGDDKNYRASFETEAKAMAKLNHTNLVGIYDFGEMNGMLYIVMEYIPGRSLFDTANGKQVDEKEAAHLIADMCDGLAHAHDAGMLHRDIKPANVLIDDEARPKIVDFGLAKPMGEEQTEGVVFGTPGYTAPEVLNNPFAVDHRSDIFSMGVMLYELLTGKRPGTPVIPASRVSNTDPRFDTIISKSIHPNPAMRYSSAEQMNKELVELIEQFDAPENGARVAPGVVVANKPIGGAVASVASVAPVPLGSAKKSHAGLIVFLLLALVGGGAALVMMNSEPKGPTKEELAKAEAAKKAEEDRKKEIEEERKRYAEKKRKERKERELKRKRERAEEERQAKLEDERELEAREKKEAEREEREKLARMKEEARDAEKEAKAKKEEKVVSEFDLEAFLAKERDGMEQAMNDINSQADKLLEPVFDKLERDLKRKARRSAKGKKGRVAKQLVEKYMQEVREKGDLIELPKGLPKNLKNEVNEILDEYREKMDEALEELDDDLDDLRKDYLKTLKDKQAELNKLKDTEGAESLDEEIDNMDELENFLQLFEPEDEKGQKKKKKKNKRKNK